MWTVKNTLFKIAKVGEDLDLAQLAYRTTLLSHSLPSPAELLNSRKFKTTLPTSFPSLTNLDMAKSHQEMQKSKQTQAYYYNQTARDHTQSTDCTCSLCATWPNKEQMDTSNSHRNHWQLGQIIQSQNYRWRRVHSNRKYIKPGHSSQSNETTTETLPSSRPARSVTRPQKLIKNM